jgi:two-component system sensor histidine kinase VicK
LGLAVSKSMIDLHNGRIWVESEEGKGSTFTFLLPMEKAGKPADSASPFVDQ